MPTSKLTPRQRQHLKALAHEQKPVVQLGVKGLGEPIVAALREALRRHELIKVKLPKLDDAEERKALADEVVAASKAELVALLGRVLVLYAPRKDDLPDKPRIQLPR
ncbi:ribosome assembly RNA-binding protein YhbY [Pseudenhygromyxa sp. WMMC2535]|uniref:ribosome assembly RNA-binding protein YhbY n=1 Tax=Pseudenhygromyxa sp. WMMC2535 TaxID=2712867 RepID=UPI0015539CFB|nr:ribosome assembly RNA-binding protein YhbY [Pseudenhygromyxa sp. WMMC2535]NVB37976.1 ribosome assembly RNA-binding protein YhbY [Pseudenhygromyxa sp. WMMC2535]